MFKSYFAIQFFFFRKKPSKNSSKTFSNCIQKHHLICLQKTLFTSSCSSSHPSLPPGPIFQKPFTMIIYLPFPPFNLASSFDWKSSQTSTTIVSSSFYVFHHSTNTSHWVVYFFPDFPRLLLSTQRKKEEKFYRTCLATQSICDAHTACARSCRYCCCRVFVTCQRDIFFFMYLYPLK